MNRVLSNRPHPLCRAVPAYGGHPAKLAPGWRPAFPSGIPAKPASRASAFGVLARCARRPGFTLVELLVVLAIAALLMAIMVPYIGPAIRSSKLNSSYDRSLATFQAARELLRRQRVQDLKGAEPRIAGADYSGTAVLVADLDGDGVYELVILNNLQETTNAAKEYIETLQKQTSRPLPDGATPGTYAYHQEPYRFTGIEPMALDAGVVPMGLMLKPDGSGDVLLQAPPFVVCFDACGRSVMPVPPGEPVLVDMKKTGHVEATDTVPTCLPGMVLGLRDQWDELAVRNGLTDVNQLSTLADGPVKAIRAKMLGLGIGLSNPAQLDMIP